MTLNFISVLSIEKLIDHKLELWPINAEEVPVALLREWVDEERRVAVIQNEGGSGGGKKIVGEMRLMAMTIRIHACGVRKRWTENDSIRIPTYVFWPSCEMWLIQLCKIENSCKSQV
jgi:hypothetical protein